MIQLAIWYLRKRKVKLIMGINFDGDVNIIDKDNKTYRLYDNSADSFNINKVNIDRQIM